MSIVRLNENENIENSYSTFDPNETEFDQDNFMKSNIEKYLRYS